MRIEAVRHYYDSVTGAPHIYGHAVTEEEVEDVLSSPMEDRPGNEGSRIAIGRSRRGRYLRVIYVPDAVQHNVFVITA